MQFYYQWYKYQKASITFVLCLPITGNLSSPTELKNNSLLHRVPHVRLMCTALVCMLLGWVITQHSTRVLLKRLSATVVSSTIKREAPMRLKGEVVQFQRVRFCLNKLFFLSGKDKIRCPYGTLFQTRLRTHTYSIVVFFQNVFSSLDEWNSFIQTILSK